MTTDITELAQSLKAAAEKATPGQWVRSSVRFNGITDVANPMEQGNKPHVANTSEKRDAEFIALANPANILALVEALEKAQKSNEFLKGQLSELANFNPDWDKLEASYDSWREIAAELLVAKERIAELESEVEKWKQESETREQVAEKQLATAIELESRTVTVKQYDEFQICHYGATEDYAKGYIDCQNNFSKWLTAAGIKWEAE
ncbi:TPA: ead/Ea22-like family protein [Klebsiella oxytoca]|uniref:ead/Ea22-like family protein n=1 Tax=Klebsiella oxytoca TaxID=571 RepID=UPI00191A1AEC|nr:ead/Ea22-like family protein [Klebsiella oxytoca]HBM2940171.1 ead/Ea22-like family protein [Klebsiella oxytoca]HBM3185708.1 ead/Ea22-like family protein [Klebsiella oxytoca]HCD7234316.1 ead/Ea22-like family protein [Klebsiella oxytoca]